MFCLVCHVLVLLLTRLHIPDYRIFWTMRDDSLSMLTTLDVKSNNFKRLLKCRQHFLKKANHLLQKISKFCIFRIIRFCSNFLSIWSNYISNDVWKKFRLSMSGSVMVTWNFRSENQFLQLIWHQNLPWYRCKFWLWKSKVSPYIIW